MEIRYLFKLDKQEIEVLKSVLDFARKEDPGATRLIDQIKEKVENSKLQIDTEYEYYEKLMKNVMTVTDELYDIYDQLEDQRNNEQHKALIETATKIWDIAKISPDHGNAVMDILGQDTYMKVSEIVNKGKEEE